jgi:pyridoxine 5-phosphate synthase
MAKLGVNVDHIATLRQARLTDYPDPVIAARIALKLGVSCITVHLREDRRHIREDDVRRMRKLENCRLNLEMAAEEEIIQIALDIKPDQVTLVPEKREELTTEGGLNVAGRVEFFSELVKRFESAGVPVSLFIDPDPVQIQASAESGAEAIEINTGKYSEAKTEQETAERLEEVKKAVELATGLGLTVHAGHGLTEKNVAPIASIPKVDELNIGHSIVSEAVIVGFAQAVSTMMRLIASSSPAVG